MSATALTKEAEREAVPALPDELASPTSKLVYLYLTIADGGTIEELNDVLGLSNITLYPVLDSLAGHDLVVRDGAEYHPR